jgi:hypothetical protein
VLLCSWWLSVHQATHHNEHSNQQHSNIVVTKPPRASGIE